MAEVVAEYDASAILMASRHRAGDLLAMREIICLLGERLKRAKSAGVDLDKVSIDPGIGRWIPAKSHRHDLALLNGLPRLRVLDRPIVAALSRKSFIGAVLGEPDPAMRLAGSLSAAALAVYNGAHILRTHDVAASLEIVRLAQAARGRPAVVQQGRIQVEVLGYHGHSGDLVQALQHLGVGEGGDRKLCEKGSFRVLKVSGLASPEALIIKQEMLARGGDAAISKEALLCDPTPQRIMIFGTERQIASLMHKLKDQPLGLPDVALALEQALKQIDDVDRFG
jgi:dihydropteroate synthase